MESLFFFIWTGMFVHATATRTTFTRVILSSYPLDAEDSASNNPRDADQHDYTDNYFLLIHALETFFFHKWFKLQQLTQLIDYKGYYPSQCCRIKCCKQSPFPTTRFLLYSNQRCYTREID